MDDRVVQLFAEVLECDVSSLADESTPETTPGWDSLAMVKLIVEIEDAFDIELTMNDVLEMRSIKDVKEIVRSKEGKNA